MIDTFILVTTCSELTNGDPVHDMALAELIHKLSKFSNTLTVDEILETLYTLYEYLH
jgi:hypothetical protein